MPIGTTAVRERLIDLFPTDALGGFAQVDDFMLKEDRISAIVAGASLDDVRSFVAMNFGRLHQNVYLFGRNPGTGGNPNLGAPFGADPLLSVNQGGERHHFYIVRLDYDLFLDGPPEKGELEFAWPLKLVVASNHIRAHFTMMAKSPSSYVEDRPVVRAVPRPREADLLAGFPALLGGGVGGSLDINKGIKALWDADEIDAISVRHKRPKGTSRETMDEEFTVKKDDPTKYAEAHGDPLLYTAFRFMGESPCAPYFTTDPTNGWLAFRRYSNTNGCVDDVVRKILAAN